MPTYCTEYGHFEDGDVTEKYPNNKTPEVSYYSYFVFLLL